MKESVSSVSRSVRPLSPLRRGKLVRVAIGVSSLLAALVLLGFVASRVVAAKVRSRLEAVGSARGLDLRVDEVALRIGGVRLTGLHVHTPGAQAEDAQVEARFESIEVDLSWAGSPREVRVRGGRVDAVGEQDALRLRFARQGGTEASSNASNLTLDVSGIDIDWKSTLLAVHASGAGFSSSRDGTRVLLAQHAAVAWNDPEQRAQIEARSVQVELGEGNVVQGARLDELALLRVNPEPLAAPPSVREPVKDAPFVVPWPDPLALRARVRALAERVSAHLADGASVHVTGLRFDLGRELRFGPAPFRVQRRPGAIALELSPDEREHTGVTPLSFHVDVPLGEGAGDPTATLEGGPVPLSLLGFREGQLFLRDTTSATLRGRGQITLGDPLRADLSVDMQHVGVEHPRLSNVPVEDLSFGLDLRGTLSSTHQLVIESAKLRSGELTVQLRGALARGEDAEALIGSANLDIAHVSCEGLHRAVPRALAPRLADFRFGGDFAFSAQLAFDTRKLDDLVLDVRQMGICRALATPEWARRSHFQGEFSHTVYDPEGKPREETTGPSTAEYTPIDRISPFMPVAVLTSEDGGFFHHHGWSKNAIRRALIANLKAGRFRQGASTISMQLAKNLFLNREKTLARKLEELVLTDYLEQTFDKPEMMELYLNVIEFGPDVYGITEAARYYYGREPEELQLAECMFLASLLPSPVKRSRQRDKRELVGASRAGVDFLIRAAEKTGKISRAEMEEGLAQPIVFHAHGDRPPPRAPVRGSRFEGDDLDEGVMTPAP